MKALLFNVSALIALVPAAVLAHVAPASAPGDAGSPVEHDPRDLRFWTVLAVAFAGAAAWSWVTLRAGWQGGLAATLWVTVAVAIAMFAAISAFSAAFARLIGLFGPYVAALGLIALVWAGAPGRGVSADAPGAWLNLHIVVSVATYALITLAAVSALAVALQERALKRRRPSRLTARLPSVRDAERLQLGLLLAGAVILGLGLATGMVTAVLEGQPALPFTHKTLLSGLAFAVIVGLIVIQRTNGLAGRRAARWLLLAYLLLSLGYPGVKFVTDVILA